MLNRYKIRFQGLSTIYILIVFFIPNAVAIVNIPGIPLISIKRIYVFLWFLIFLVLILNNRKMIVKIRSFPFFLPMGIVIVSLLVVSIFAQNFVMSIQGWVAIVADLFIPSIIIWTSYRKPRDIINILNNLVIIFVFISIYGIVAYTFSYNPVIDFINTKFPSGARELMFSYAVRERFGMLDRAQSIFPHAIQYGCFLVMIMFISFCSYSKRTLINICLRLFGLSIMTVALLQVNSRSPILFALVAIAVYWVLHGVRKKLILMYIGIIGAIFILTYGVSSNNAGVSLLLSIFRELSGSPTEAGGSSVAMRIEQLKAATLLFSEKPILGHGLSTVRGMIENNILPSGLYRAEGFLFRLMINTGLFGILAYAFFFYKYIVFFLKVKSKPKNVYLKNMSIMCLCIISGYLVFILVTGIINTFGLFLIITTLCARYIYLKSKEASVLHNSKFSANCKID